MANAPEQTQPTNDRCECGAMTAIECGTMPGRHCGLWDMTEAPKETQTTKVQVGMIVQDNDPRMPNRRMKVFSFDVKGRVILRHPDRRISRTGETRISLDRIYTDGKPRKSGWSVVTGDE